MTVAYVFHGKCCDTPLEWWLTGAATSFVKPKQQPPSRFYTWSMILLVCAYSVALLMFGGFLARQSR